MEKDIVSESGSISEVSGLKKPSLSAARFPPFANCAKDGAPTVWLYRRNQKPGGWPTFDLFGWCHDWAWPILAFFARVGTSTYAFFGF